MPGKLARTAGRSLAHYDPEKGLKLIAVTEAAEKHYTRAKDATKLRAAVVAKLKAQREFVVWWDVEGPGINRGGRPRKTHDGSDIGFRAGHNGLPDAKVVQRWRHRSDPRRFESTVETTVARCIKIAEFQQTTGSVAGVNQPESDEWYTPARYLEAARIVLGAIDLDPASCEQANDTVRAARIFTIADNGLQDENGVKREWAGRIWLNPPYSGNADDFVAHLLGELWAGRVSAAILLVNSHATDTRWFQPCFDALICFTDHRINFVSAIDGAETAGSNHGSVFVYFGVDRDRFIQEFSAFGAVVERAR